MMPMYMNSSQPSQMRPQGHHHQGFGNYSQHNMTMDASSPVSCEHWPTPSPCYGSCIHGNFPAYTPYWPPCYPPQVPPYHTCCANHPGFHPHASPYYVHQPFPGGYQPVYESEKDVTGKRPCTNCSSQMWYPKNDRSVVIEEHEPEIEKGDHGGEAVNHVRSTNCPYPIIWIPHENARNQESRCPAEIKVPQSTHHNDPKSWNGRFPFDEATMKSLYGNQDRKRIQNGKTGELPFDISKLKSLLQGLDGKEAQIQKNKEEPGQLQYPIFWIPSRGKREDVEAPESREGSNGGLPSDLHVNEGQIAQQKGEEGKLECKLLSDADDKSSMRNIPVVKHLQEPRNIPVKLSENHLPKPTAPTRRIAKNEQVENAKKEKSSSSSPKASTLPPVCLRVDPLPKKRNGGSKSLSPPRRKEQLLTTEETKVASPVSSKKTESRTVPEACGVKCEEASKEKKMFEECLNSTETEKESAESKSNLQEGASIEIVKPCETKEEKEKPAKKTFAEEEAARIIQSRYRGYDVRRWEPIKKLKEIATVREQMGDIKKRMQALEVPTDQHTEEKEMVILGEMVMSLLLKLDSVQGLHPSIRDFRKSLARELSDMQENLDSLKKSIAEKEALEEQVEITSQTSDRPVNLEHSQLVEESTIVSDSNTEKVDPPYPDEHPMNMTDEQQPVSETEEGTGFSETSTRDTEPAADAGISEADSTTIPQKSEAVEAVLPISSSSADGNEVTNTEEDKVMVENLEEPLQELPQVMEMTHGPGFEVPENATEVSETESEERKGDDDSVLSSEKDVELSELPVGVIDDEKTQFASQDSILCTCEAEKTIMDPQTASQQETNVDHSYDHSEGMSEETAASQEETERPLQTEVIGPLETEVTEHEIPEETKKLMEENQRFKETMETLVKAGREQLEVISKLTGRVKSLEKKLSQKKRTRIGRRRPNHGKDATKPLSESYSEMS
ncbi:unnamed protein product [Thlaspi arvense]|uniref:BAG domain-containing protein n=1 Tax=Thlaspi arvense TaxID=13288 RepID=A0AAU9S3T6_THLAR|nr:unnamed protein product [Thlaspi arvense]